MRLTFFLVLVLTFSAFTPGLSQKISVKFENAALREVFKTIRQESGLFIVYNEEEVDFNSKVSVKAENVEVENILNRVFEKLPYDFEILGDMVVIKPTSSINTITSTPQQTIRVSGVVMDKKGETLPGVTIQIKGTNTGGTTDDNGRFLLQVNDADAVLIFSFIGMKTQEVSLQKKTELQIVMEEALEEMEEFVVTGIFQRKKESFTGSSTTFNDKELKMVGNQNVLQSLKTLDPSFNILENNDFGSNPNRLPDIEIRGKSSVIGLTDEYQTDPNQPLFILDGFESTLQTISDLSMDRVESITLLKDAAATAIYGSKAANGVVVVETKKPEPGQLKVNYNANFTFSFADLSDYNLMNSYEKLTYEKLAGRYGSLYPNGDFQSDDVEDVFNERMKNVKRGVNSYWLSDPLRFAFTHRHNLFLEGGDESMRYGVGVTYGKTEGIMKESNRDVVNGNIRLIYRKGNLSFANNLNLDFVLAEEESIPFSRFARANPYYPKVNEYGEAELLLEAYDYYENLFQRGEAHQYNPLYDLRNNNQHQTSTFGFTNNFEVDWRIINAVRARGKVGLTKTHSKEEKFLSPFNSDFQSIEVLKRGTYDESNAETFNYDLEANLTYGKLLAEKHMVNAIAGGRFTQNSYIKSKYQVEGFIDDDKKNPSFSMGYEEGKTAEYLETKRRAASYYINVGYAYDNRYLLDATFRSDGSSVFGANKQFSETWSVGLGWNIHNEYFFKNVEGISLLKLRASIGNPGNQNFSDYVSMLVYEYNHHNRNPFGSSVIVKDFGNSNLKWQKTIDRNIGFDLIFIQNRLRINFDYFSKKTDPLLVFVYMPTSVGTTRVPRNLGGQLTKGLTMNLNYTILRKEEMNWSFNLNLRHLKSEYRNMDSAFDNYNLENQSRNLTRYYNGGSPTALWAVISKGIDPATGREVFINKNGYETFVHNYDDEVIVGNSEAKVEGVIGSSFYYKGFTASVNFRYRLGGQIFMKTLYEKVENITTPKVMQNQDKRALYDRWKQPGDIAKFKAISSSTTTPMSSRFVEDNNVLTCESVSVGYETEANWLKNIGASSLTFRAYMNDIFRISTVKNERGIDYPFARSFSMSVGLRF